ncbi:MAG: hypothetical protein GWN86_13590 [Desulfobacterales bacterium]|nr:hypothetical protein [Desulfobacterales bacterium]
MPKRHFGVQARSIQGVYPEVLDPSTQLRVDAEQHRSIEGLAMTKRGLPQSFWSGRRCFGEKLDVPPLKAGTFTEQQ